MAAVAVSAGYAGVSRGRTWIEGTTTASVALLAGIAAVVSYGHMHLLALRHGEGAVASALIPLSVDGMIVAASMSLLLDSRLGRRGGFLPWTLLIVGALASLAANIAVAEPTMTGRVIAAWPSFALTASYELLMRQVRRSAACPAVLSPEGRCHQELPVREAAASCQGVPSSTVVGREAGGSPIPPGGAAGRRVLQRQAWQWALANRGTGGSLPTGTEVARQFRRSERWGRLVKNNGLTGQFDAAREGATGAGAALRRDGGTSQWPVSADRSASRGPWKLSCLAGAMVILPPGASRRRQLHHRS